MEIVFVVGGAFLSALFPVLLKKLSTYDLLKYARQGGVEADLKEWETMLKDMKTVLEVAEEQQMENQDIKHWLYDLRDLAYDMEDLLDDFAAEGLRLKAVEENVASTSKGLQNLISPCFSRLNLKDKLSSKMVSKVKKITAALDKMRKRKQVLNIIIPGSGPAAPRMMGRRPTSSVVNETKVYGREKDKEEVLKLMKREASDGKHIRVVPITGMGGLGKTTLAQLIYKEPSLEFDKRAWVSVGEDFDVVNVTKTILKHMGENLDQDEDSDVVTVTKTILKHMGENRDGDDNNLNLLQEKLMKKLRGNKVLIVLDDVWNDDYKIWSDFYCPLEASAPGSRIIVTTRDEGLSKRMADPTIPPYRLEKLSDKHCLLVFAQHALEAQNFYAHQQLKDIGEQIVKKCDGLPLAAMSLGGLLRGNLDPSHWTRVLKSPIWDLKEEKSILPALKLSYHHLHSPLKRCFTYCAIFPKEYEFDKDELVLLWMAEGLMDEKEKVNDAEVLGQLYFDQLFSKSFFQKSPTTKFRFVMHDLIVDLARSVSQDICFHLEDKVDNADKVRHSSFMREKNGFLQKFEIFYKMNGLRTFLSLPNSSPQSWEAFYITSKVLNDLVPELQCLRVLSLVGYSFANLPSSIGSLKHLRYVDFSYTEITGLPESFCQLINLQTLRLCGCKILIELPSSIGSLMHLRMLDLSYTKIARLPKSFCELIKLQILRLRGCKSLVELPTDIGNLIKLQQLDLRETDNLKQMPLQISNLGDLCTLSKFVVGKVNGLTIEKLNNFPHLYGELQIMGLHNVDVGYVRARPSYLKEKGGLSKLVLEWVDGFDGSRNEIGELEVLNSLQPLYKNLEEFSIKFFAGREFPSWIGDPSLEKMVFLELCTCPKISVLPPLWQLPSLTKLVMKGMDGVKTVGVEFHGDASACTTFRSLETLIIENLLGWEQWSWSNSCGEDEIVNFPKLSELRLINCPKLVGKLPNFLPSLETLEMSSCPLLANLPKRLPSLHELNLKECQAVVLRLAADVASISTLRIERIVGLASLHECALNKHSNLKRLEIYDCGQLVSLVDGDEEFLPFTLADLRLSHCSNLDRLPRGLHSLTSLKGLYVFDCPKLVSFPITGLPSSIGYLMIGWCRSLEFLPQRSTLDVNNSKETSHLERVYINECPSLMSFPIGDFPNSLKWFSICGRATQVLDPLHEGLSHLTRLYVDNCPELESFPEHGFAIPTLTYLAIRYCGKLMALPNHMDGLVNLQELQIINCAGLRSFPEGGFPRNLKSLYISRCDNLSQPLSSWRLNQLTCLKSLTIRGPCPSTDMVKGSFPSDGGSLLPTSLTHLGILDFKNLKSISKGLQVLTSLRKLQIWRCPQLKNFPKKGIPATTGCLSLRGCPLLEKRCSKDKGDLWPIISHYIPWVDIGDSNKFHPFE